MPPSFQQRPASRASTAAGPPASPAAPQPHPPQPHPRNCSHYIQFYSAEPALYDAIGNFILPAFFSASSAAVIVATKPHIDALEVYLRSQNLVPEMLKRREQLELLPAEEILEYLLPEGRVSAERFNGLFGPLFAKRMKKYPQLLVYGELVNMLCERGEHEKAHELECVWEVFLAGKNAELLCGYNLNAFSGDGLEDVFQRICRSHSHVAPAEEGPTTMLDRPEDQMMVLAMLQQKTLRLEAETGRRLAMERTLRDVLELVGRGQTSGVSTGADGQGSLVQMTPQGICSATMIDHEVQLYTNSRFLALSGLSEETVQQRGEWLDAVHYQDRDKVSHSLRLADSKTRSNEYRFVHPNGRIVWVRGESTSSPTGYTHIVVDISQFRGDAGAPTPLPLPLPEPAVPYPYNSSASSLEQGRGEWTSSIAHEASSYPLTLYTPRSAPDARLSHELTVITRSLWDILRLPSNTRPYDALPHSSSPSAASSPAPSSVAATIRWQLDAQNAWRETLPPSFLPSAPEFRRTSASSKPTIRLIYAAYLCTLILITRPAMLQTAETAGGGGGGGGGADSLGLKPPGRIDSADADVWSSLCVSSADEAVALVSALLADPHPADPEVGEIAAAARSSRLGVNVFYVAAATLLLHLSLPAPLTADRARRKVDTLTTLTRLFDNFTALLPTAAIAAHYLAHLRPFLTPATGPASPVSSATPAPNSPRPQAQDYPLEFYTQSLRTLFAQPAAGAIFVGLGSGPYEPRLWGARDLLLPAGHPPLASPPGPVLPPPGFGGRGRCAAGVGTAYIVELSAQEAAVVEEEETRGEKRRRSQAGSRAGSVGSCGSPAGKERRLGSPERWGMSRELEALFRSH